MGNEQNELKKHQYDPFWLDEGEELITEERQEGPEELEKLIRNDMPLADEDWLEVQPMDRKELMEAIREWAEMPEHANKSAFHGCRQYDCFFHRSAFDAKSSGNCAYMPYMIDHPEHRPQSGSCMRGCLPGEDCIRYLRRTGTRPKPRPTSMVLPGSSPVIREPLIRREFQFDERMAHDCYVAGMNDGDIADKLHVSRALIRKWRDVRGYPAIARTYVSDNGRTYSFDVERARTLYEAGLSDKTIAKRIDAEQYQIYRWRHEEGLPTKYERSKPINEEKHRIIRELYDQGKSDEEIGKIVGCARKTISNWRFKRKLNSNRDVKVVRTVEPEMKEKVFRELHEQGMSDRMIADRTGYSTTAVKIWRKQNGLERNRVKAEKTEDETFLALYNEGLTDEELKKRLGCSETTVRRLRGRNGLKKNKGPVEERK